MKKIRLFRIHPSVRKALQPIILFTIGALIGWSLSSIVYTLINAPNIQYVDCSVTEIIDAPEVINEKIDLT